MYTAIAIYTYFIASYTAIYVVTAYMYYNNDPNDHVIQRQVVYF